MNEETVILLLLVSGWCEARRGRWWGAEGVRLLAHEAHQWRLCRGKWLCHQGLWHPRWRWRSRSWRLAELAGSSARSRCSCTVGVVAAAASTEIVILIRGGVEAAPVIATPVGGGGGGGRAVSVAAVTVEAAASVFATAASAHAAVALILVHEVRVVGVASTVTHPTSWCQRSQIQINAESYFSFFLFFTSKFNWKVLLSDIWVHS